MQSKGWKMWFLGADRLRRIWEKQKIKGISRAVILRLHYFKASLIILEGTNFEYLAFVWQETSKYTVFQLFWLTQLSCSALPQWKDLSLFGGMSTHLRDWNLVTSQLLTYLLEHFIYIQAKQCSLVWLWNGRWCELETANNTSRC